METDRPTAACAHGAKDAAAYSRTATAESTGTNDKANDAANAGAQIPALSAQQTDVPGRSTARSNRECVNGELIWQIWGHYKPNANN